MYNFIGDIENVDGFILCTGSEAQHVFESMERNEHTPCTFTVVYDSCFVEVLDGYYGRVYGYIGTTPHSDKQLTRLR
jgi:hypothetical protein